jgi:hypothetical protein
MTNNTPKPAYLSRPQPDSPSSANEVDIPRVDYLHQEILT